jgi:hypothetical protein
MINHTEPATSAFVESNQNDSDVEKLQEEAWAQDTPAASEKPREEQGDRDEISGTAFDTTAESHELEFDPEIACDLQVESVEEVTIESRDFVSESASFDDEPIDTFETSEELPDTQEDWERRYPYEVPRPALSIEEAATILGKSVRSLERSILGKWGNKLPEGWKARRMRIDGVDEWRIIPPPGFRVRHTSMSSSQSRGVSTDQQPTSEPRRAAGGQERRERASSSSSSSSSSLGFGFSLEKLIASAGQKAKNELVRAAEFALDEHPTIVIDRSDDVERLLRELNDTQKELAEQRKMHLQDLRLLAELQGSMRLLEMNASQTNTLKEELELAALALREHKRQYQEFLNLPWWKRLFKKSP